MFSYVRNGLKSTKHRYLYEYGLHIIILPKQVDGSIIFLFKQYFIINIFYVVY